jgi:hypothetical protein
MRPRRSEKIGLRDLIDVSLVALSDEQTRQTRIIKTLLEEPEILPDKRLSLC